MWNLFLQIREEKGIETMIVDNLNNCALYEKVHKDFAKVFEVLKKIATGAQADRIVLDEGNVWINAPFVASVTDEPKLYEAHREFIDIHYVISGAERFGCANVNCLETTKEYNTVDDYELLTGKEECIILREGDFCIVFPQDAHIPACQKVGNGELKRVVAKIRC